MKGIKHHLNVLIISLRVILFCLGLYAMYHFVLLAGFISKGGLDFAIDYTSELFKPLRKADTVVFPIIFVILHIALIVYLIITLVRLYKSFLYFEKERVFYQKQGEDLRKIGAGIIIFAKGRYLLFCTMGVVIYFDLTVFFTQLIPLLGLYLVGKIFLVLAYISEKGEVIKEENELTI